MVKPTTTKPRPKMRTSTPAPRDKHYYVADQNGIYCLACGLPARNQRHAPKAA